MKNTFCNTVSHDKLRGLLPKKKVPSLLMLIAVGTAIFATPTVSFAHSHLSNGSSQSSLATLTQSSHRSSKPTVPLTAIRMLDKAHGWALTSTSVLKTSDGGLHWTDVTPPNSPVHLGTGTFMNQNIAWVVGATNTPTGQALFTVQRTSDDGIHWQSSQFSDGNEGTSGIGDPPHFINMQEGWLDVQRSYSMGAGTTTNDVFHTTDGGSHWSKLATDEQIHQNASVYGRDTGISAKDRLNIWDTIDPVPSAATGTIPTNPVAFVTHDGAKTWQQQTLPSIPGLTNTLYRTTPPVFFGNYGLMPVEFSPTTDESSKAASGLSIYMTQDGGIHWSSSAQTSAPDHVYILDRQHTWLDSWGSIHASNDGGKSWNTLGSIGAKPYTTAADMSFTDPNTGWIVTSPDANGNGSQLLHTTDGGHTWQQIPYSIQ